MSGDDIPEAVDELGDVLSAVWLALDAGFEEADVADVVDQAFVTWEPNED